MSDESTVVSPQSEDSEEREPEAHDADATRSSAHDLGDVTDAGKVQNHEAQVGADGDAVDYYRFTLTQAREMRLGLWHREGDAELFLEDAEGTVLGRSVVYGHGKEAMVRTLGPGTYYVRVEAQGPEASAHQLKVLAMEPYEVYTYKGAVFAKLLGLPSFGEWRHEWSLSENADGSGEPVSLGTAWASDPDGDVLRYTLVGGNESGRFSIDASSGEVFYIGSGVDYESGAGPYELTVRASDGTHTIDATVTVTVADIPEAPVFTESSYEFELAENADGSGTPISLGAVSATDPDGATVGYTLVGGNESGLFAIDEASGEVFYAGSGEDHESVPSHELTVRASDGTSTTDTTVTVSVIDAPEAPAFAQASYEFFLAENADGSGTPVSLGTVAATDPDRGDTLRYSLVGGNESGSFTVDAASGEVFYAGSGEDFESGVGPYELTVRASDETLTVDATVTVTVTDVPEAPQFTEPSYEFFLAENAVGNETRISLGTVSATDPEGATVGYTLVGGNESGLFAIDEVSGEVFYAGPGEDFESVTGPHALTIRASDGTSSTDTTVTVTVTDVPEAPEFAQASYEFILAENADGSGTPVSLGTVAATDPDRGDTLRYTLVGGNDSGRFTVDASSGEVFYAGSGEDFESGAGPFELTVRASDETSSTDTTVTVTVTDVPEAPEFAQSSYEFTLAENTDGSGTPISLGTVAAADPEGATVGYSLVGGNESGRFAIDASSGEVFYAGPGEDFESVPSHELTVRASDGTRTKDMPVTVTVTDIRGDSEASGADLPPDTTTPAVVLVDEGAVRGNIESTTDWDWFAVDLQGGHTYRVDHRGRSTGDGTLVDPVLMGVYEYSSGRRLLSGTATSDGGTGHNAAVEFVAPHDGRYYIWVSGNGYEGIGTGTYELEVSTVPVPVFGEARYGFTVAENADGSETPISLGTVTATDPDGGTLRYSLVGGNDSGRFTIDASSGELFYAGPGEDYESDVTSYRLTVRASDGTHSVDTTVTIAVTNDVDAPSFAETGYAFFLAENVDGSADRVLLGTVSATDPDGDSAHYSLEGGNESGRFTIDAATGELFYVGTGEDFESGAGPYELTVRASDATNSVDATVTVTVTDEAEGPAFAETSYAFDLPENTDGSGTPVSLGAVSATDPNDDTLRYSLAGGNESGRFTIDAASGEFRYVGTGEDFEGGAGPYELTVRASDGTHSVDATVTVTVTDVQGDSEPASGDLPADTTTDGVLIVDEGRVTGTLRSSIDRDWFAVTLAPGRVYAFNVEGDVPNGGTAPAIRGLRDSNGNPVLGITGGAEVRYTTDANASEAVYYVEVGGADNPGHAASAARGLGIRSVDIVPRSGRDQYTQYSLRSDDVTDLAADTTTKGRVEVAGSVTGKIEYEGDRDWFAMTLEADTLYQFEIARDDRSRLTPFLRGIYDTNGNLVDSLTEYTFSLGWHRRVFFTADADATYYAEVASRNQFTGAYRLSLAEIGDDDYPTNTSTTATATRHRPATGEIEWKDDHDWIAIAMMAGQAYRITLRGAGDNPQIAGYISGVYDSNGNMFPGTVVVGGHEDANGYVSKLSFVAPRDGTYYVSVGGKYPYQGTYSLSVWHHGDDFGQGTAAPGMVEVGGSTPGRINFLGDLDWFTVSLQEGRLYELHVSGAWIRGLYDAAGAFIDTTGRGAKVFLKPGSDATYFFEVAGNQFSRYSSYTVSVRDVTDVPDGEAGDIAADTTTTGVVEVGDSVSGEIGIPGDRDWFAVALEAGKTYRIDLDGRGDGGGTLWNSYLPGIYNMNGIWLTGQTGGGDGFGSPVDFTATRDATYYVAVGAWDSGELAAMWGTYTLSVEEVTDAM